jgi:hypothetical protein
MLPNLHNPIVGVPISLELIREGLSEFYALLRLVKTYFHSLTKRPLRVEAEAECGRQTASATQLCRDASLCKEPVRCCCVGHNLQKEVVPAQSRP